MEYNKQMGSRLIIGLGNPGPEYENTYHNVGVMALDRWIAETNPEAEFQKHGDYFSYVKAGNIVFVRPLVFMNESGLAAREACRHFDAPPESIAVIHDDSDLPLGNYRITQGGGSAGHKGVQSIIDHLHTPDFQRIRIGIRNPKEKVRKKASDFVLRTITAANKKILEKLFAEIIASPQEA